MKPIKHHDGTTYRFIYVDQKSFEKHPPTTLAALATGFSATGS